MIRTAFILFLFVPYAVSDTSKCVRYTFEQNFNEWLTYGHRHDFCYDMPFWIENQYSNIDISAKNDQSTTFSMPGSKHDVSCMSSFMFTMQQGGTIEVNIYKDDPLNFIEVTAVTSDKIFLGIHHSYQNSVIGWDTLKITLTRNGTYEGYIFFLGFAIPNSIVLVDSFRYIPPGIAESDCRLYEYEPTTPGPTTPELSTPELTTSEQTTLEPTTPEPTTPKQSTPVPTIPQPTTPEPTTPEPTTLELFTLEPTTLEPTTLDSITPEPTTPKLPIPELTISQPTTTEPTTPEPTTLELSTKELTTPEPTTLEPTTPGPTTSELFTQEPSTLEPTTLELTMPELTTPEPITPEPNTPEASTLVSATQETTPQLITPEPAEPDTTTPVPATSKQTSLLFKLKMMLKLPLL